MAELRLRISGIGGQGIVFAGRLLAQALAEEGKEVALRYAYGAEVMGTPVHSELVVSEEPILSPYFREAQVAVILHPRAFPEAMGWVERGGLVVLDAALAKNSVPPGFRVEARPFVQRASAGRPGDPGRLAPVAALGFLAKLGLFPLDPLVRAAGRGRAAQENLAALKLGFEL
ncbi:MAG: 2-oxoacid:acceptor oxidoreductase family protein [Candidatus Bipolaricaulota bacterium]|nr:2-oxoacid:acceptor oxidoreductase family protein [Candidatus Bipolaricaulota bacterium]MCX7844886.1 2-oxoacid:acceptor oxidoreductase family protein [Candidatus Bipolaricaulota bacterium]MDW8152214.1 2-oxoacid:acceptor oxidoreductase family protein [Candidatus Bipolaricaulota bacterium]